MRSYVCFVCLVAAMVLIWTQYMSPYLPKREAPQLREQIRAAGMLGLAAISLTFAIVFVLGDQLYQWPAAFRYGVIPLPILFMAGALLAAYGIWPPRKAK